MKICYIILMVKGHVIILSKSFIFLSSMADAFEVSLDYLVGATEKQVNKEMLNRIEAVDKMKPEEKK